MIWVRQPQRNKKLHHKYWDHIKREVMERSFGKGVHSANQTASTKHYGQVGRLNKWIKRQ